MDRLERSRKNKNITNVYKGNVRDMFIHKRPGWKLMFKKYVDDGEDELLIPDYLEDDFDETDYLNKDAKLNNIIQSINNNTQTYVTKTLNELISYERENNG